MRHTISVLVENKFGVLSRVSGLFSGRGFNIESLSVAETMDPETSKMTIVTTGDDQIIEQVIKQLRKLIDIIKVQDFTGRSYIDREMVLVKVNADENTKSELLRIVEIFRGKVVDVGKDAYVIEITGTDEKVSAILKLFKPLGIKDIVRTGKVAMLRSDQAGTEKKSFPE